MDTITITREQFDEYKKIHDEAVKKKHSSFVWKGALQKVGKGYNWIVDNFASHFKNSKTNEVTLNYTGLKN